MTEKIDGRKVRKKIQKKPSTSPQWVRDLINGPEMLAKRMEGFKRYREAGGKWGRITGQPDGIRKRDWIKIVAKAEAKADKVIKAMADKNIWEADNDVSSKAMKSAITIMETATEVRLKLAAAKTILDFTQTKPVVKNETTVKTAEDFLNSLIDEEKKDGSDS